MQQKTAKAPLTLKVNGQEHQLLVKARQILLEVLRDDLRLTGTKRGCEDGTCGTCIVTLNGTVARARLSAGLPLRFDGVLDPTPLIRTSRTGGLNPYPVYVSATHMAEVEVDLEQGMVRVLRIVAAHDVGRVVYPQGLKGQIEGAVAMGVGFALKEEFHPGETTGFKEYRIPTIREVPEVAPLLVEMVDPSASLGAKGVAECATVAMAPAIADATGARIHHLPATPPRLLALMGRAPGQS